MKSLNDEDLRAICGSEFLKNTVKLIGDVKSEQNIVTLEFITDIVERGVKMVTNGSEAQPFYTGIHMTGTLPHFIQMLQDDRTSDIKDLLSIFISFIYFRRDMEKSLQRIIVHRFHNIIQSGVEMRIEPNQIQRVLLGIRCLIQDWSFMEHLEGILTMQKGELEKSGIYEVVFKLIHHNSETIIEDALMTTNMLIAGQISEQERMINELHAIEQIEQLMSKEMLKAMLYQEEIDRQKAIEQEQRRIEEEQKEIKFWQQRGGQQTMSLYAKALREADYARKAVQISQMLNPDHEDEGNQQFNANKMYQGFPRSQSNPLLQYQSELRERMNNISYSSVRPKQIPVKKEMKMSLPDSGISENALLLLSRLVVHRDKSLMERLLTSSKFPRCIIHLISFSKRSNARKECLQFLIQFTQIGNMKQLRNLFFSEQIEREERMKQREKEKQEEKGKKKMQYYQQRLFEIQNTSQQNKDTQDIDAHLKSFKMAVIKRLMILLNSTYELNNNVTSVAEQAIFILIQRVVLLDIQRMLEEEGAIEEADKNMFHRDKITKEGASKLKVLLLKHI
ncbi:MAG: hypothetical protein EZS28_002642 [Streblomastix strix]|uniref:Uncharacterized protein n=1 Tax=Streblomastix strix TaxID=222440 RepID=A0A5J4X3N0_9EUKA|nr:MAG: hypothetical protein EZS28_002642 [Streblomastix strix]